MKYQRTLHSETTIEFQGHSDDTFGWYSANEGEDDDDCANCTLRTWRLTAPDGSGLHVSGRYGVGGGLWMVGLSPLEDPRTDDGLPLPAWPMMWRTKGYGVALSITVPAGTTICLVEVL